MKSSSVATQTALVNARDTGIVPRDLFWITVKDRDSGDPETFGFWSGDQNIQIEVLSGTTGLPVTRTYYGGVNLVVGDIPRVSDNSVQSVEVSISAIPDVVQQCFREYDPRLGAVEIHSCLLDPATRLPVDEPEIDFLGVVAEAPIETGSVGGESQIKITVEADSIAILTRKNPRKRSYQGQRARSDDRLNYYAGVVGNWQVSWGETAQ